MVERRARADERRAERRVASAERRLVDLESVFGAIAHASRRQILLVLHFRGGAMTAGEIANRFGCSWPTTTRHLRVLEDAGLVSVTPAGRNRVYRLERERLRAVAGKWLGTFDVLDGGST